MIESIELSIAIPMFSKLKEQLITGETVAGSKKSPFLRNNNYEVIVEERSVFGKRIENLRTILHQIGQSHFYIFRMSNFKLQHNQKDEMYAFRIDSKISTDDFFRAGHEQMVDINGLNVFYFDDSYEWCILKEIDVLYITGNVKFINTFFGSYDKKISEVTGFISSFEDGISISCPNESKNVLRVIINGKMYDDYNQIKNILVYHLN